MKKLTIEFIIEQFEKGDYILLTTGYESNKQKLKYICPNGHRHNITWNRWKAGQRCPYCVGLGKPTIEFIHVQFEKECYILLTTIYKNSKQKLEYICPNGHRHSISWDKWRQGYRCPYCSNVGKPTIKFIRDQFEKDKYILLTEKYINSRQRLNYVCLNGHKHVISWNKWKAGRRCPVCAIINMSGSGHPNWQGGISCEPYCDVWIDRKYKDSIKQRDNHKCINPYCQKKQGYTGQLTIHHIDYNKKSCGPENLITLCRSCNSRANKDRNWHTAWYQAIMYRRYEYVY